MKGITEPSSTRQTTSCIKEILDAVYEKADITSAVKGNCKHLSTEDKNSLIKLLNEFPDLFDGTLDD